MKTSQRSGNVIALMNSYDDVPTIALRKISNSSYGFNGDDIALEDCDFPDYDENFDVYFHQSDDGATMYNSARVLDTPVTAIPPNAITLKKTATKYVAELMGQVDPADVNFAFILTTNPVWLHKAFVENNGDIEKAQLQNLRVHWDYYLKNV